MCAQHYVTGLLHASRAASAAPPAAAPHLTPSSIHAPHPPPSPALPSPHRQQPHERQRFQEMATPCCAKPVRNSSNIFWLCSREALATSFTSLATSSILW